MKIYRNVYYDKGTSLDRLSINEYNISKMNLYLIFLSKNNNQFDIIQTKSSNFSNYKEEIIIGIGKNMMEIYHILEYIQTEAIKYNMKNMKEYIKRMVEGN